MEHGLLYQHNKLLIVVLNVWNHGNHKQFMIILRKMEFFKNKYTLMKIQDLILFQKNVEDKEK
jgi:hypothetical protein